MELMHTLWKRQAKLRLICKKSDLLFKHLSWGVFVGFLCVVFFLRNNGASINQGYHFACPT